MLLILSAFAEELSAFVQQCEKLEPQQFAGKRFFQARYQHTTIAIAYTGIGHAAAQETTALLIQHICPSGILFVGTAGGLQAGQKVGELVIANAYLDVDTALLCNAVEGSAFDSALYDPHRQQRLQAHQSVSSTSQNLDHYFDAAITRGCLASTNVFPAPKEAMQLIQQQSCLAVEMEAAGFFRAAVAQAVPALMLRAVSNQLDAQGNDLGTDSQAIGLCAERLAAAMVPLIKAWPGHETNQNLNQMQSETQSQQQSTAMDTHSKGTGANELIARFDLEPHPEGGFYKRIYTSQDMTTLDARFNSSDSRPVCSAIYFLLGAFAAGDFSAWHRIQSDECWHHYSGAPLQLYILNPNKQALTEITLGQPAEGFTPFYCVPHGSWFAAKSLGEFSFFGCTVSPGFDFADFELAQTSSLIAQFPAHQRLIQQLCRNSTEDR